MVLACTWVALAVAAFFYSQHFPEARWIFSALLPAFLAESACYLASLFEQTRKMIGSFRPVRAQAVLLWLSGLLPYLIFSLGAGTFHSNGFYLLVGLTAVFSFWQVLTPRRAIYDIGFLVIAAAPIVARAFARIYQTPDPHLRIDILGQLMWIRLGIAALLILRRWDPGSFGLWPAKKDWRAGLQYYLLALVPVIALALAVHDVRYVLPAGPWWRTLGLGAGTFFGFLWVVALSEELFFRGVIARALLDWLPSPVVAILLSALVYGSAHLWFRTFPDWRRALVAAALGLFCGLAYWRTRSVRASVVTHALIVTTWRLFFK